MSRFITVAGQRTAELAARLAEGGRLSRGRALYRKGAVSGLTIAAGSAWASVRGSHGDDYTSTVATAGAPPSVQREVAEANDGGVSVDELIDADVDVCPRDGDLVFDCDCADWEEPCKHVVAVLLALADRVDLDVNDLLRWRGITGQNTTDEVDEGGRRNRISELEALLGDTALRPTSPKNAVKPDPARPGPAAAGAPEPPSPELAEFLGVGMVVDPPPLADLERPRPLFEQTEVGALADLGPELARALATIAGMLSEP